ncbi:MAG: ATP phosphoribosyltransferase [Clostridia bacterium]
MTKIKIALAKGRLAEKAVELFEQCGVKCKHILEPSRKLIFDDESGNFEFIFVKPTDVPTYVEYGVVDLGICGKDTLLEEDKNIYELLDLKFAKCKLCFAGYIKDKNMLSEHNLRVATKYVNIATNIFEQRNQNVEIIKLNGSIELGPIINLSDVIFDVVESGKTLSENNLSVLEEVFDSSARLVCNKVSLKTKAEFIKPFIENLSKIIEGSEE